MLKKNARVLTAILLIALITFSSITLLARAGRALKVDLTQDRIYSLSGETKKVMAGLTHPVRLKLFYSRTEALRGFDSLRAYSNYFSYIRDLLREYASRSRGKITLEIIDPRRDSREEREAIQYGLRPIPTAGDDRFYFGLVLTTEFGREKAIPLLSPERQQLAEYDITEMIHGATSRTKKTIGILSTVNLAAAAYPAGTARAMGPGEAGPKGPSALEPLRSHYDLTLLTPHADLRNLDAVMVVHPRNLPEQTLAALDRYVTAGGKLVVFQDPAFMADPALSAAGSPYAPVPGGSNLNRLLAAWGCEMAADRLAADPALAPRAPAGPATLLTLKGPAIVGKGILNAGLNQVRVLSAGSLKIRPVPGIAATVLLQTTETGCTVRADDPQQRTSESREAVVLGVRLTGSFRSALEGGPVSDPQPAPGPAAGKSAVVVFSDVDMLTGPMAAAAPAGGNADLLLATMESLTGPVSLASIKARGRIIRPFSAVDRMEERYDDAAAAVIASLQAEIAAAERELGALARKSQEEEESLLKEEILHGRKKAEAKIARAKEELAALQHGKRAMVESLFTKWKVFILLGGPALVLLLPAAILAGRMFAGMDRLKRKSWKRGIW